MREDTRSSWYGKTIDDVKVNNYSNVNIFLGANGCGKTSLLKNIANSVYSKIVLGEVSVNSTLFLWEDKVDIKAVVKRLTEEQRLLREIIQLVWFWP